jgi:hypothetical protein
MTIPRRNDRREPLPIDDIGGYLIILTCLLLMGFGRDSHSVESVLLGATAYMFGKHSRKPRR